MAIVPITCTGCGMQFGGISGFKKHRTGVYEDDHPYYGRRCRTAEEMAKFGYVEKDGKMIVPMPDDALKRRTGRL